MSVDAVHVAVERVPQHLGEEGKPEFTLDVDNFFEMCDLELLLDTETS